MITETQRAHIREHAYIPEHITHYVTVVSETEPFLVGDFLAYVKTGHLIFIGYPLQEAFNEKRMGKALGRVMSRFKPAEVALIAPALSPSTTWGQPLTTDSYYTLDLSAISVSQKLRNMIKRAERELSVERTDKTGPEHEQMIDRFLRTHPVEKGTQLIFKRIPEYVSMASTAWVFNVRNKEGELVGFDVAEFSAKHYAMYMFNFISQDCYVPGASDLLLFEMTKFARKEKKEKINLGLGINQGVTFFKKKWGGEASFPYVFCLYSPLRDQGLENLLGKL